MHKLQISDRMVKKLALGVKDTKDNLYHEIAVKLSLNMLAL